MFCPSVNPLVIKKIITEGYLFLLPTDLPMDLPMEFPSVIPSVII